MNSRQLKNYNAFKNKANEKYNNKYQYHDDYVNSTTTILITCLIHGTFKQTPSDHLNSKYGCKECAEYEIKRLKVSNTFNKWINKSKNKFNDKFTYDYSKCDTAQTKLKITCPIHGEFQQLIDEHYRSKYGCPKCGGYSKDNTTTFIDKAIKIHGHRYDYTDVKYNGSQNNVTIICNEHGPFEMTPDSHINQKANCPECKRNAPLTTENVISRAKIIHKDKYKYIDVDLKNKRITYECTKHGVIEQDIGDHIHCNAGCSKCGIITSKGEDEIYDFISSIYDGVILRNNRDILKGKELDIYLPELNVSIEYHGVLWHSIGKTYPNTYDNKQMLKYEKINKYNECAKQGIHLFQIFENEWIDKKDIWKSMISNKLNKSVKRIYARKCEIQLVKPTELSEFLNDNHMQGADRSSVKLGLYYDNELILCMSLVKPRYNKKYEYEISRICTKLNYSVIGGVSKLLKYFEKQYNPKSIISYANRRWSQGNLYKQIGFNEIKNNSIEYFYLKSGSYKLMNRTGFMKNTLSDKLEVFDSELTELDNMLNNGYRALYGAGSLSYVKSY